MNSSSVLRSERGKILLLALALMLTPSRSVRAARVAPAPPASATSTVVPPNVTPEPTTVDNVNLPTVEEVRMGREGSVEVEKDYKLVKDEAQLKRLQTIGDEMLRASNDPVLIQAYREEYKV